jgi:multisubunit Na+/H+ antiporter MnhG subunit
MHPEPIIIVFGIVLLSLGILGLKGLRDVYKKTGDLGPGRGLGGIAIFIILGILLFFMSITGFGLKKSNRVIPKI